MKWNGGLKKKRNEKTQNSDIYAKTLLYYKINDDACFTERFRLLFAHVKKVFMRYFTTHFGQTNSVDL